MVCLCAAFVRASAFAASAPLATSGAVPKVVRASLAMVLTPVIAAHMDRTGGCGGTSPATLVIENAVIGFSFGISAAAVAAAASSAGGLIDGALAAQAIGRDAVLGGSGGPMARLLALGFAFAFVATGALTHLCRRFVEASPAAAIHLSVSSAVALGRASTSAALEIAGPAICAQVLATVIAAFVARAAPRINGLMVASPATSALVLLVLAMSAPALFGHLAALARAASTVAVP